MTEGFKETNETKKGHRSANSPDSQNRYYYTASLGGPRFQTMTGVWTNTKTPLNAKCRLRLIYTVLEGSSAVELASTSHAVLKTRRGHGKVNVTDEIWVRLNLILL